MRSFFTNSHYPSARSSGSAPLAIVLLTLAAVACSSTQPGPPPTVNATTPLDAAANVDLATAPTATFDRAMAPLAATNFKVTQGTTAVAGAVTTSADGMTATF